MRVELPVLVQEYGQVIRAKFEGEIINKIFRENAIIVDGDNVWFKQPSSNNRLVRITIKTWNITFDENDKMTAIGSILTTNDYHQEHYFIKKNKVEMLSDSWIDDDKIAYHQHLDDFGNKRVTQNG
jgi:hypothetical protein